jgi:SAM-dependent methyltransferase
MLADMSHTYTDYHTHWTERAAASATAIVPIVMKLLTPESVVDVGCGVGAWLAAFGEQGVSDFLGVDGDYVDRTELRIPLERFVAADLVAGFMSERRFDLAVSLEVGEHLSAEAAPRLVESLVALAPAVLFSAAIPGQGGIAHVNEQWPAYWAELFARHDYRPLDLVRGEVWDDESVDWWYRQNVLVYLDPPLFRRFSDGCAQYALRSVVHPAMFAEVTEATTDELTLRELLRRLPRALSVSADHHIVRHVRRGPP